MIRNVLIILCALTSLTVWSQENAVTIGGGYSFANIEDADANASGFRINGLYEFNPAEGKVAHGLSVGFISVNGKGTIGGTSLMAEYKINSWPIYYAPKFMFGQESFKGFVKGALGFQFSDLQRTSGVGTLESNDSGFYAGLGLGGMYSVKENIFINLEYEWAYMGNSYYRDGFMNSIMLGIGFKF